MKYKVSYNGFLQKVERFFPTFERAEQWLRQIGKFRFYDTKIEEIKIDNPKQKV